MNSSKKLLLGLALAACASIAAAGVWCRQTAGYPCYWQANPPCFAGETECRKICATDLSYGQGCVESQNSLDKCTMPVGPVRVKKFVCYCDYSHGNNCVCTTNISKIYFDTEPGWAQTSYPCE